MCGDSSMVEQLAFQLGEGGSIPTTPLQYIVCPISYREAKLFIEKHHYSHSMGPAKCTVGLMDGYRLVGAISFGHSSGRTVASSLLKRGTNQEVLELRRMVLLDECPRNSESYFISRAISILKKQEPSALLLVAFADCNVGHSGLVYRASGWKAVGQTVCEWHYEASDGTYVNKRAIWNRSRDFNRTEGQQAKVEGLKYIRDLPKNRYIKVLYPKKVNGRLVGNKAGNDIEL